MLRRVDDPPTRTCWVYKGRRRPGAYLYLPAPDDPARVPSALLERLGELELVLTLELSPQRRLARADARAVLAAIEERGFYLQLPPAEPDLTPGGPS
jgi:uncharacterized protein YcgL (UPF0745 family)